MRRFQVRPAAGSITCRKRRACLEAVDDHAGGALQADIAAADDYYLRMQSFQRILHRTIGQSSCSTTQTAVFSQPCQVSSKPPAQVG